MFFSCVRLRKRAFSLIESAIVLGVVGLVIGGIWIAMAAINLRMNRLENVRLITLIISNLRHDFANMPPVSSGTYGLSDYIKTKGIVTWPYANATMPWRSLKMEGGKGFHIYYNAPGSSPSYRFQESRFSVHFGYNNLGSGFTINSADCYFYLSTFQEYYWAIDGHGVDYSYEQLKNSTTRRTFCNALALGEMYLIFDR